MKNNTMMYLLIAGAAYYFLVWKKKHQLNLPPGFKPAPTSGLIHGPQEFVQPSYTMKSILG